MRKIVVIRVIIRLQLARNAKPKILLFWRDSNYYSLAVTEYFKNLRVCRVFVFVSGIYTISLINTILRFRHQQSRPTYTAEFDNLAIHLAQMGTSYRMKYILSLTTGRSPLVFAFHSKCQFPLHGSESFGSELCNSFLSLSELNCG